MPCETCNTIDLCFSYAKTNKNQCCIYFESFKKGLTMKETDPLGIPQHEPGAKLDDGKIMADLLLDFSLALEQVAKVGTYGAKKYSRGGWLKVPNGIERYTAAMMRHILKEKHEEYDPDTELLHASHTAWNALSRLELILREKIK